MKMLEVNTITRRKWEDAQRLADLAIIDIPERHNRVRAHIRARELEGAILMFSDRKEINVESEGQKIVYMDTINLGSKRYPDYVRDFYELSYKGNERKVNVWFIYG